MGGSRAPPPLSGYATANVTKTIFECVLYLPVICTFHWVLRLRMVQVTGNYALNVPYLEGTVRPGATGGHSGAVPPK